MPNLVAAELGIFYLYGATVAKKVNRKEEQYRRLVQKISVLAYYGKGGHLKCCYRGCNVTDADMLGIHHVESDGYLNKCPGGRRRGGASLIGWIIKNKFPKGLKTFCASHNQKCELMRRRKK